MSAKRVEVGPAELWALAIGSVASSVAGELVRLGGYPEPSAEQWQAIAKAVAGAALAVPLLADEIAAASDEQLEAVAADIGARVIREVLGPAPMAN